MRQRVTAAGEPMYVEPLYVEPQCISRRPGQHLRFGVLAGVLICGCSFGPSRVEVPELDPAEAASAAVEEYDSDKDQSISQSESSACPAIAGSFKLYDANQDGLVSQAEVQSRLEAMLGAGIGRMPCMCVVYAGDSDRPIEGAKVRVVPEPFLERRYPAGRGCDQPSRHCQTGHHRCSAGTAGD